MEEQRRALLIGNQHYPDTTGFKPLNSPRRDVQALEQVLKTRGDFHDVTSLIDNSKLEIEKAVRSALRTKRKNDLLVIYYSGHGKTDDDLNLYLATHDTEEDYLEDTAVDAAKISRMMSDAHAEKTVLVLDCCHAGAFPTGYKSDNVMGTMADRFATSGGTYVLMACDAYDLAKDGKAGELSAMTHHIVKGLEGAADDDRDGQVTVNELTAYLDRMMTRGDKKTFNTGGTNQRGQIRLVGAERPAMDRIIDTARDRLNAWARARTITDEDCADVMKYFAQVRNTPPQDDDPRWTLIKGLSDPSAASGAFVSAWVRANTALATPAPTPDAPQADDPKTPEVAPADPPPAQTAPAEPDPEPAPTPKQSLAEQLDADKTPTGMYWDDARETAQKIINDWWVASEIDDPVGRTAIKFLEADPALSVNGTSLRRKIAYRVAERQISVEEFATAWSSKVRALPISKPKPKAKPPSKAATPPPEPAPKLEPPAAPPDAHVDSAFENTLYSADDFFDDHPVIGFLIALMLCAGISIGLLHLFVLLDLPGMFPVLIDWAPYFVLFGIPILVSTVWTFVHGERKFLDFVESILPWVLRTVALFAVYFVYVSNLSLS